jgi:hypothetical protein
MHVSGYVFPSSRSAKPDGKSLRSYDHTGATNRFCDAVKRSQAVRRPRLIMFLARTRSGSTALELLNRHACLIALGARERRPHLPIVQCCDCNIWAQIDVFYLPVYSVDSDWQQMSGRSIATFEPVASIARPRHLHLPEGTGPLLDSTRAPVSEIVWRSHRWCACKWRRHASARRNLPKDCTSRAQATYRFVHKANLRYKRGRVLQRTAPVASYGLLRASRSIHKTTP